MKLRFIDKIQLCKKMTATVHKTGKLGFNMAAADNMGLSLDRVIKIAVDEDEQEPNNLYLFVVYAPDDGFKVCRAGKYYYLNTKGFFDRDVYSQGKIVYHIQKEKVNGEMCYKLMRIPYELR